MNKRLAASMIFLSWIFGLLAFFQFQPVQAESSHSKQEIYAYPLSDSNFDNSLAQSVQVEVPSFKVDWKLYGKLNASGVHIQVKSLLSSPSEKGLPEKSSPLFDVKTTFLHFFYTW